MSDVRKPATNDSRREFLKTSSVLAAGALVGGLTLPRAVHADGGDVLRVGLVGCGGRGTGAAAQALQADPNAKLVAMGDAFADRLQASRQSLQKRLGPKVDVPDDRCFTGFDNCDKVLECDLDVIILAAPPHFRPAHLKAAVEKGVHVFAEKPVAVDAPGVRSVLESSELAKKKGLSIVSGLCWRYDYGVRETINRILDGAIGDVVSIQENYLTGPLWHRGNDPSWSQMEYQLRNWIYFTWLSGDHNVEQHVHSLDKAQWILGDTNPIAAVGLGGRQVRTDEKYGHIFDHHAVCYEYANGVRVHAYTRQQAGCANDTEDYVFGTKGSCQVLKHEIRKPNGEIAWKYSGPKPSMYQVEHDELFRSIREGKPINNGHYMALSTMVAIMGRMATYSGQRVTWEQAFNSTVDLSPKAYEWGDVEVPPVAMPGITKEI